MEDENFITKKSIELLWFLIGANAADSVEFDSCHTEHE